MKKIIAAILLILIIVIGYRTSSFLSKQMPSVAPQDTKVNVEAIPALLSGALKFETISQQDPGKWKAEPFDGFHEYLKNSFPTVHDRLPGEVIGGHSLLYIWKGTGSAVKPILLMAHMDVVPAEGNWKYPPYSGAIADGFVWGRGALDDKSNVIGILNAVEELLKTGFTPKRTIYLAFGHDEEASGLHGAAAIAAELRNRNVQFEFIVDEGLAIVENMVKNVTKPVALIGIAEKGYLTLELSVEGPGGHSSTPPQNTTIGILSQAIQKLEENPMPARIDGTSLEMFRYLGPEMPLHMRVLLANLWLTGPIVRSELQKIPGMGSMLRTTTAVTMIQGGIKENVLARKATATVNFRILPGDSVQSVTEHVQKIVDSIEQQKISIRNPHQLASEPSKVSSTESQGFKILSNTIRQVFPDVIVAPSLLMGATDSRHYSELTGDTYRFSPFRFKEGDLTRVHGENERIPVRDLQGMLRFYVQFMRNL